MTKELYRDIYLMISNHIAGERDAVDTWVGMLEDAQSDEDIITIANRIKKHRSRLDEYEALMEKFESEVEEV